MRLALDEARAAGRWGEVPVGAVAVVGEQILGRGANAPIRRSDPTAHAEVIALREAARTTGNYRLVGATLYCTVEPCLMCIGATLHARIDRLVFGATDPKVGATAIIESLGRAGATLNHRFTVEGGVLAEESSALLHAFFRDRRPNASEHEDD